MNADSTSGTSHGGCKGPRMEHPLGKLRECPSPIYQELDWTGDDKAHLFVIVSDPSSGEHITHSFAPYATELGPGRADHS